MWLLQHKNIHKRNLLWLKIFALCLIAHSIVLFWIFCVYHDKAYIHAITINKNFDYSVPIIFKPYTAPPTVAAKIVSTPVVATKLNAPAAQRSVVAKKSANKPTTQIKTSSFVKTSTDKAALVKTEEKPKAEEKAIVPAEPIQPTVATKKVEPEKPIAVTNTPKIEDTASKAPNVEHNTVPAKAQISHDFREVEALRRGAQLQKELVQKWQPPIGISPDCFCEISFFVDKKGAIHQLKMVKSSGVIMFDISARQALFAMKMPQWTYGKPLTISFKQ